MTESTRDRPSRGIWLAWSAAFLGGLAVLGAVALALYDPCLQDGRALAADTCGGSAAPTRVLALTTGGTLLAVIGGLAATVLTLRRRDR